MANRHINFDKTEIVLIVELKKGYQVINLAYDKVARIQFDTCTERKLFQKVPSEKITIQVRNRAEPVVYTKMKEKKFFDEYKEGLRKFAADNRLTFADNTAV